MRQSKEIKQEDGGILGQSAYKSKTDSVASPKNKSVKKYNDPPLTINILYTQYEVMHEVAAELNFKTSIEEEGEWDVWFIDGPTIPALLIKMKNY